MRKERRLTGSKRFSAIRQEKRALSNRLLVLKMVPNGLNRSRFGFLVGRRIGGAVVRNRVKRRLREAVGLAQVDSGWDIVFIARTNAPGSRFAELRHAAEDLLRRARVLPGTAPSHPSPQPGGQGQEGQPREGARATLPGCGRGSRA
jgi:ribonuclease P protein component